MVLRRSSAGPRSVTRARARGTVGVPVEVVVWQPDGAVLDPVRSVTTSVESTMTDVAPQSEQSAWPLAQKRPTDEDSGTDEDELRASLTDLAALVMDSRTLHEFLASVATCAEHAIPGADGAGVALLRVGQPGHHVAARAASRPFVAEIDEIQYGVLHEGPCITAALECRVVRSGSLGGERLWPRFGPRVGRLGVHSVLSLPLLLPGQVVGAIDVYARSQDVFDEHAVQLGEQFASPAAVAVHNAQVLAAARELATQLQTALFTRPVIDQAIGLLRGRSGGSADEAFAQLRRVSQREHTKLAVVAEQLMDEAVRRARARHAGSSAGRRPAQGAVTAVVTNDSTVT